MNHNFEKIMAGKSDEELIIILTVERKDYRQEAIEAAEVEYKKRDISEDKIKGVQKIKAEEKTQTLIKSEEELDMGWKIFAFLFPGMLLFIFSKKYEVEGYTRKAKELSRATIYGFCFYIGIIILLNML